MKKLFATIGITVAAALMVAMTVPQSHASPVAKGAPAIHIDDFGCGMIDGNGFGVLADRSRVVITSSGNGNLSCKAKGVANSTGQAVHYDYASTGALCATFNGLTQDWSETVSASGNASLSCHTSPP